MADLEQLLVRGWELLRLSTDQITVDVVPGLGGTITSIRRRADDTEILWQAPWGLRMRGAATLPGSSEAKMIDTFAGGWQSLFPNGGDTANAHGVEWGYDGEARLTPLEWEQTPSSVVMTGRLVRSPFEITRTLSVLGSTVTVGETVRNVGGEAVETIWGQQVILGAPLLGPEAKVDAAASTVHPDPGVSSGTSYDDITPWPRVMGLEQMINLRTVPAPDAETTRRAYLGDFTRPHVSVVNKPRGVAVDLEWDLETWPHVWYSLEAGRRGGFPWYKKGYFLALTPSGSWPAHGLHDARRISSSTTWIQPDTTHTSHLSVTVRDAG